MSAAPRPAGGPGGRPVLLKGGRLLDPSRDVDGIGDLLVVDGRIEAAGGTLQGPDGCEMQDASGLVVAPGLVDLHVHFREPGGEHKETIATGARAAAAGGFTTVWTMPNTDPPIDDPAAVGFVRAEGERAGGARVMPIGAASVGLSGERMTEVGEMVAAGAVAVSDDGHPIWNAGLLRRLLEYTQTFGIPVLQHSEVRELAGFGVMNEGKVSTALGLRGQPNAAEAAMVARDIQLAELTGGHLHVCHVSARQTVEQLRLARERGLRVTSEVTPHHLALTETAVRGYRTEAKMNPPLRTEEDREAVRRALVDGVIDVIATDHAPHHYEEKEREFDDAPFGIVGLETALGLAMCELVEPGHLSLAGLVDRMSCSPARIMGIDAGTLRPGSPADIVLFDPGERWTVEPEAFLSRSRNTPFRGRELTGRVHVTLVGGVERYRRRAPDEAA
ncbi:MAG: dihydroorotase [Candidatus Palauibacterales bacterium]|nr:dihydroorotase [Candidatus Palauibacterales bacterium]MDP2528372.1 dihydroorotase [Candidatus Palauibacterales bacterium]MDP2583772.1 dihydroorotase [Candidatus Palauibacterales bacterium]